MILRVCVCVRVSDRREVVWNGADGALRGKSGFVLQLGGGGGVNNGVRRVGHLSPRLRTPPTNGRI